jgi:hypothetical protein
MCGIFDGLCGGGRTLRELLDEVRLMMWMAIRECGRQRAVGLRLSKAQSANRCLIT